MSVVAWMRNTWRRWRFRHAFGNMTAAALAALDGGDAHRGAEQDRAELAERRDEQRRQRKDRDQLHAQLDRVAPFVPRWEISL